MRTKYLLLPLICLFCLLFKMSAAQIMDGLKMPDLLSTRLDLHAALDAPAGKHGFVTAGKDGHFYFQDGVRARFWGVNVSSTRLNIPRPQIEQVVDNFARAGLNMVRLEAIDNRNCLLGKVDAPDSRHFNPQYLDRIDYWMACLKRHGLYYYLDLLDFRTFKAGDEAPEADKLDRAARPEALYDPRLIELQKEYASQLLLHRNPYSGLRPIDDPAFALIEICNEHGFFMYPDRMESIPEPYRTELRGMWSAWLRDKYKTRDALAAAWGVSNGFPLLRDNEDPMQNQVDLPNLLPSYGAPAANVADSRRAPGRLRDGVQFFMQKQKAYLTEMRDHLRKIGCRIPVTGVFSGDILPDLASVADTCDFMSDNWYGEYEHFDKRTPDVRYYSGRNPLTDDGRYGIAPSLAMLKWNHKPVVIREWAISWPNPYRAALVPEALAYAAFQDVDAMLLFGYQTVQAPNGALPDALNDYSYQSDPAVWGMYGLAGQAFLSGAVRPAQHTLNLKFPAARLEQWPNPSGDVYRAAWSGAVENSTGENISGGAITPGDVHDLRPLQSFLSLLNRQDALDPTRSLDSGMWGSDTGEITRYTKEGRLEVRTPRLRMIAGPFSPDTIYDVNGVRFNTPTKFGALLVYSLDGLPIETSRRVAAKMVSLAENTGQNYAKAAPGSIADFALNLSGKAPVVTLGRKSEKPTRLWFTSRSATVPLLSLWLENGTWEALLTGNRLTLDCDTPDMDGEALGKSFKTGPQIVEIPLASRAAAR